MPGPMRVSAQFPALTVFEDAQEALEVLAPRDVMSGIPTSVVVRVGRDSFVDLGFVTSTGAAGARVRTFAGDFQHRRYVATLRDAGSGLAADLSIAAAI